jgi:hypothetical protein
MYLVPLTCSKCLKRILYLDCDSSSRESRHRKGGRNQRVYRQSRLQVTSIAIAIWVAVGRGLRPSFCLVEIDNERVGQISNNDSIYCPIFDNLPPYTTAVWTEVSNHFMWRRVLSPPRVGEYNMCMSAKNPNRTDGSVLGVQGDTYILRCGRCTLFRSFRRNGTNPKYLPYVSPSIFRIAQNHLVEIPPQHPHITVLPGYYYPIVTGIGSIFIFPLQPH